MEASIKSKPTTTKKEEHICYVILTKGDGYAAVKQAAENTKRWRYSGMMSETYGIAWKTKEELITPAKVYVHGLETTITCRLVFCQ